MSELMRLARAAANGRREDGPAADATVLNAEKDSEPLPHSACAACLHFTAATGKTPDGWCGRYGVKTWAGCAAGCRDGFVPRCSETRAIGDRRRKVAEMARLDPALQYAYEVVGASPIGAAAGPLSVMLGLRDSTGTIVAGELTVAAERWDMAAFFAYWDTQGRPS
ncbi:MAG TPA: hypothetical protein VFX20_15520 [Steroidobacteraceae bacterium]|nr:hypothetical protein [Steroidobacteraceae bacterium]